MLHTNNIAPRQTTSEQSAADEIATRYQYVPQALRQLKCWCTHGDNKAPRTVTGKLANVSDPSTWTTFEKACIAVAHNAYPGIRGIGFVFRLADGYVPIDLDGAIDEHDVVKPWAFHTVAALQRIGTYVERSSSLRGLHGIVKSKWCDDLRHGLKFPDGGKIETWGDKRFLIITGNAEFKNQITVVDDLQTLFPPEMVRPPQPERTAVDPNQCVDHVTLTDDEILELVMASAQAEAFATLWNAPTDTDDPNVDDSAGDMSLCNMLAFWTGRDPEQMDRLFRRSRRMRPKWNRPTYGRATIDKAVSFVTETYAPGVDIAAIIEQLNRSGE